MARDVDGREDDDDTTVIPDRQQAWGAIGDPAAPPPAGPQPQPPAQSPYGASGPQYPPGQPQYPAGDTQNPPGQPPYSSEPLFPDTGVPGPTVALGPNAAGDATTGPAADPGRAPAKRARRFGRSKSARSAAPTTADQPNPADQPNQAGSPNQAEPPRSIEPPTPLPQDNRAALIPPGPALIADRLGLLTKDGWVFQDVNLVLRQASVAAIVGPAGSGRSSLLLALSGRMTANTGTLTVAGHLMSDKPAAVRALTAVARIGSITGPEPGLTVAEAVSEQCLLEHVDTQVGRARFAEACDALRLTVDPKVLVGRLAGEPATLLALALACVRVSAVILLDDLDRDVSAAAQQRIVDGLLRLARTGPTIVVSTTDRIPVMEADVVLDLTPSDGAAMWQLTPIGAPPGTMMRQLEPGRYPAEPGPPQIGRGQTPPPPGAAPDDEPPPGEWMQPGPGRPTPSAPAGSPYGPPPAGTPGGEPPSADWTPPSADWTPPPGDWSQPQGDWEPPPGGWRSPQGGPSPSGPPPPGWTPPAPAGPRDDPGTDTADAPTEDPR